MPSLAVEILSLILGQLIDIQDILNVQQVSKQFYDIVHDPSFVKGLYARSDLPRPPGPFSWQSPQLLLLTLVKSDHIARTWKETNATRLSIHGDEPLLVSKNQGYTFKLLQGRWCFHGEQELRCLDLEAGRTQVLRKVTGQLAFSACIGASAEGEIFYVLTRHQVDYMDWFGSELPPRSGLLSMYREHKDTGSLSLIESFNIPDKYLPASTNSEVSKLYVQPPLVSLSCNEKVLVFDSQSRVFYTFQVLAADNISKLPGVMGYQLGRTRRPGVILAKTHVIVYMPWIHDGSICNTIHAFALDAATPTDDVRFYQLHVTHQQQFPYYPCPVSLLFDPIVDLTMGYTRVGFLNFDVQKDSDYEDNSLSDPYSAYEHYTFIDGIPSITQYGYVELILDHTPNNSGSDLDASDNSPRISSIPRIHMQELFSFRQRVADDFILSSPNGHLRGICYTPAETVCKFTVNLSDRLDEFPRTAVAWVGNFSPGRDFRSRPLHFNGVEGRVFALVQDQYPEVELWVANVR